jgi:hypothetical protein
MVPDIGPIVTGTAEAKDARLVERVIQPGNSGNIDLRRVEKLLAARDRLTTVTLWTVSEQISPIAVEVKNLWGERRSRWIVAQRIVDADEELRLFLGQRDWAAMCTPAEEIFACAIEYLRGENAGTCRSIPTDPE